MLPLVLVLGSVFTGGATSIQELVKDRVIYQRERALTPRTGPMSREPGGPPPGYYPP